jgi:hypothetical protein
MGFRKVFLWYLICVASNCRMPGKKLNENNVEESGLGLIELLSRHLPGGTEKSVRIVGVNDDCDDTKADINEQHN